MKLADLMTGDLLRNTIYGERYLNDTKGNFNSYSELESRYDPQGQISYIYLPYSFLEQEQCVVLKSDPSQELMNWVNIEGRYRFLWHPGVARHGLHVHGTVRTQPTSSTRTLLTEQDPRVYIKTDLDKKHFRFVRRLQRSSVEHSIAICSDLRNFSTKLTPTFRYCFLPESLGLVIQGGDHEGSGVLFRETKPYPEIKERRVIVPYHSLYADDPNQLEDKPLLVQLIELHAGQQKIDYFVSEIVGPIIETWVAMVSTQGLLPELHGQNALAEIDEKLCIRRVAHRDFQGTYSDSQIRINLGLPLFTKHVVGHEEGTTVKSQYSHVFDGMIGRYLLSRLTKTFCIHFGAEYGEVTSAIRTYHHSLQGWREASFPETTYRFAVPANQQMNNDVQFVDSGERPDFR